MRIIFLSLFLLSSCEPVKDVMFDKPIPKTFNVCEETIKMDNKHDVCFMRYYRDATVIPCEVAQHCLMENSK